MTAPLNASVETLAPSPEAIAAALAASRYLADDSLATAIFLAVRLGKPLLLEGAPGVGKTEAAKAIADMLGRSLIRLQCYEGIDAAHALYEWNYQRQLLAIRHAGEQEVDIYDDRFLIARPLLQTLRTPEKSVLLVDEIDRSDHEFEALLLEFLSDFQISIPERGTLCAKTQPIVILTSNRTREIHDALKRRCLYHWVGYPDAARELAILKAKVPDAPAKLSKQVVSFVQAIRKEELFKAPGVAESLDWATALVELDAVALDPTVVSDTLGALLKYQDDIQAMQGSKVKELLDQAKAEAGR